MKTVGEILKAAREEKGISLDKVVAATKIKKQFLRAIEENNFQKFSSRMVARGLIKNYSEFLGLPSGSILAVFKRDFSGRQEGGIVPKGLERSINQSGFTWTPTLTLVVTIVTAFLILLTYLGYQYFSLIRNPKLEVFQPEDGQKLFTEEMRVTGKTDLDTTVTVSNKLVSLSSEGNFVFVLNLLPGENKIVVEAVNRLGKKTTVVRSVFYLSDSEE